MIKKFKNLIVEYRKDRNEIKSKLDEIIWANVFHDSVKGISFLENSSLNIGRWAGNYSFFYVLHRILNDFKPNNILEFGLGESSKFVNVYLNNYLVQSKHLVIEQSQIWLNQFTSKVSISDRSNIKIHSVETKKVYNYETKIYSGLDYKKCSEFDFYIIDGPIGSERYSRYNIVEIVLEFKKDKEFIILLDDYNRVGEKDTVREIETVLTKKNIDFKSVIYNGEKSVILIATPKYYNALTF